MANQLKMAVANAIITLNQRGWSNRRISRELGIDRETVKRHLGRVFNFKMEQITLHVQGEPGKFQTKPSHIDSRKISHIEQGTVWLLRKASLVGSQTDQWAQALLKAQGIESIRPLVGLLNLAQKYPRDLIEDACEIALSHDAFRLRTIRKLIKKGGSKQEQLEFIDEHPIIHKMSDYGEFVKNCFKEKPL